MSPDTSSTSPVSRLKAWQSAMPTPPGLSTKNRSTQRRPSRRHSLSTRFMPREASTGVHDRLDLVEPLCILRHAATSQKKKWATAHFFQDFSTGIGPPQAEQARRDAASAYEIVCAISRTVATTSALGTRRSARVPALAQLHHALLGQRIAHGHPDRDPEQVGVLELDAGALLAIVHEHVEAGRPQLP